MYRQYISRSLGLALLAAVPQFAAPVNVSAWSPIYQGVDYAYGSIAGTDYSAANAVRIDLSAPGISFVTTPHSGPLETTSETTSQFLVKTSAAVAINANFFAPCCNSFPEPKTLIGLAVSGGSIVAPPNSTPGNSNVALLLSMSNGATIESTTLGMDLSNVYNAVAGSAIIVQNGQNIGNSSPAEGDPTNPNPRSDVGLSQDGKYLYFVTIDGRQPGYSIGTTMAETADILIGFGAYTAMNLDGGGSTSLVRSDGIGGAIDLNRPSGGVERFDANHLGVVALSLATPEPGTLWLLCAGLATAGLLTSRRINRRQP